MPHDRDEVVTAIRRWYARHGRPPSQKDWDGWMPEALPSTRTIRRRFGWRSVLHEALGAEEPRAGRPGPWWSRSKMIKALLEARVETGGWPSGYAWEAATAEHPARRTYVRLFGSWASAIAAAEAAAVRDRSPHESSSRTWRDRQTGHAAMFRLDQVV
jgi:hypothetical protein